MDSDQICFASVSELAAWIRQRQVSAVEVLDAHLGRLARHNPALNAIVTLDEKRARQRARDADDALAEGKLWGPLHGVPVTVKDALETAGLRTTGGFEPLANYVPLDDAPVVARLRAAGAIVFAKTNLPVLSGDFQADNPIFGRTNNPWNLECTPGGSTGGGAAALAAGLTPLEIGSDIAGSVRIPAHYCGVFALKPTEHRVPTAGHIPRIPGTPRGRRHVNVIGPLTRSIDDLALALRVIAGPDAREWEVPPAPLDPVASPPLKDLRLAWCDHFDGVPVTRDTRGAMGRLASELEQLGCRVERREPKGFEFMTAWETWGELVWAEVASSLQPEVEAERFARLGASLDSDVPIFRGMARGREASMRQYTSIMVRRDALIAALELFLSEWDALLCPVTVGPAIQHCPPGTPIPVDGQLLPYFVAGVAYTVPFSLTGHPAVVMPLAQSVEGLPIGLQVVGRRWDEMRLLAIAGSLSEVTGPCRRPPGF